MSMNKNLALVWVLTLVILLFQAWSAYDSLPDRMPSHFNFQGEPDSYSSKNQFFGTWLFALVLLNVLLPSVHLLIRVVPSTMINVPHREYWLATSDRKREVAAKMANLMVAMAIGLNLIFFLLLESIRSYTLTGTASMPFWTPLVILPFLIIVPLLFVFRMFRVPPSEPGPAHYGR
jgi:uncharacterized membrane protein